VLGDSNTPVCVRRGEQDYNEPNQIYLKHIVAISAGWDHSMALEKDDPCDPNLNGRVVVTAEKVLSLIAKGRCF